MKPKTFSIVLLMAAMAALSAMTSACSPDGIRGSGMVISEPREVKDFTSKMTGATVDLKVAISGAGDLSAQDFASKNATVSISGAGHAIVKVSDRLDVEVSGVAEVEYVGDPMVTKNTTGVATVTKRS